MLSDRDQQVLTGIGRRLAAQDPALEAWLAHQRPPGSARSPRATRWTGAGTGVLVGVVAPAVVLATVPTLPAVVIALVLAVLGRVVGMCAVDDSVER